MLANFNELSKYFCLSSNWFSSRKAVPFSFPFSVKTAPPDQCGLPLPSIVTQLPYLLVSILYICSLLSISYTVIVNLVGNFTES